MFLLCHLFVGTGPTSFEFAGSRAGCLHFGLPGLRTAYHSALLPSHQGLPAMTSLRQARPEEAIVSHVETIA